MSNLAWGRNKAGKKLAWFERPQVAMQSQLPRFLVPVSVGKKSVTIAEEMPQLYSKTMWRVFMPPVCPHV